MPFEVAEDQANVVQIKVVGVSLNIPFKTAF